NSLERQYEALRGLILEQRFNSPAPAPAQTGDYRVRFNELSKEEPDINGDSVHANAHLTSAGSRVSVQVPVTSTGTADLEEEQAEKNHLQQLKKAKKEAYKQKVGKKDDEEEEPEKPHDFVKQVPDELPKSVKSSQMKKIHGALRKGSFMGRSLRGDSQIRSGRRHVSHPT
ncbi:unnamed protein product, partial [Effrenium voratum]